MKKGWSEQVEYCSKLMTKETQTNSMVETFVWFGSLLFVPFFPPPSHAIGKKE